MARSFTDLATAHKDAQRNTFAVLRLDTRTGAVHPIYDTANPRMVTLPGSVTPKKVYPILQFASRALAELYLRLQSVPTSEYLVVELEPECDHDHATDIMDLSAPADLEAVHKALVASGYMRSNNTDVPRAEGEEPFNGWKGPHGFDIPFEAVDGKTWADIGRLMNWMS